MEVRKEKILRKQEKISKNNYTNRRIKCAFVQNLGGTLPNATLRDEAMGLLTEISLTPTSFSSL